MNELSIKEKASRYDEAIEVINKCKTDKYGCIIGVKPTDIFPELKESYDDRIRKEIIRIVDIWTNSSPVVNGIPSETLLAWLEKKGEQKISFSLPTEGEFPYNNPADTLDGEIENIWEKLSCDNKFTATKDGFHEVVVHFVNWYEKQGEQKTTDKAEPKFRVKYADSEYNVLEVKDIDGVTFYGIEDEPNHIDYVQAKNCARVDKIEQNPAWSKKDDRILDVIIEEIEANKSNAPDYDIPAYDRFLSFLKSIKDRVQPQNTWKPSKHELEVLKLVAEKDGACLMGLYEQLKKLKEE